MKRALVAALVVAAVAAGFFYGRRDRVQPAPEQSLAAVELVGATLLDGLGDYSFPVTTSNPEAQRWFNQGLMLTYGFNHDAAERSFLKATRARSRLRDVLVGCGARARAARQQRHGTREQRRRRGRGCRRAVALAPKSTEREQAFIRALAARYAENPPEDRRTLDEAYAAATGQLVAARPDDLDAAVFHAEALMDLQPWDYYDEQLQPKGNTAADRLARSSRSWRGTRTTPARCTCTCTRSRHRPIRSAASPRRTGCAR